MFGAAAMMRLPTTAISDEPISTGRRPSRAFRNAAPDDPTIENTR